MSSFKMSSATGKAILAIARGGDFAHPGESLVIESLVRGVDVDPDHCVLDAGCGRGGTADVLQQVLQSKVFGIDVDEASVAYAQRTYPNSAFSVCNILDSHSHFNLTFDLVTVFNVFYSLTTDEQQQALSEFHALTASHAKVILFDYTSSIFLPPHAREYRDSWQPLVTESMEEIAHRSGWVIERFNDYSTDFEKWYQALLISLDHKEAEIAAYADSAWFDFAKGFYQRLYDDIRSGEIGGGAYFLQRIS
ncbi:Uncharacterised protein [BD1-7 clade bacterium]|uniref:Methyltransferase domain-containing protein n=1 Tax=BD1-7 clade bacterium TaxID=2029982 RepID=A0A5S9QTK3_9GAMM|nr:Uncharacterised protein [BD1-7 clade bacterium]CAA0122755.1 Uncharacterised protein [BD1-7 clade bacterium]